MLWGAHIGNLEVRAEGGETRLRATFPYGQETVLAADNYMELREVIAPRAFAARIDKGEDIHFLAGHDYDRPLASIRAGNLTLTDTDQALVIDARIDAGTSWARDFLSAHASGLVRGLSPGFRVPEGGEVVEKRPRATLRTIRAAELFEISAVTVPAYPDAQIEMRSWNPISPEIRRLNLRYANTNRWR